MAEKKGIGSTMLGWFVTREGEEDRPQTPDELLAKYPDHATPPPIPVELKGDLPTSMDGSVDFAAVFKANGMGPEEQGRIEKAIALLKGLPAQTPADQKKMIVETSLKAFGIPIDEIIEAGGQEIQALEVYIRSGEGSTQGQITDGKKRIEDLNAEIARINTAMQQAATAQERLTNNCNAYKLRVQEVLEFFGADAVARVVRDSPKLHEKK